MNEIRRNVAALTAAPFAIAGLFWWVYPVIAFDADTQMYLQNNPMRTATYPLFLDVFYGPALLPLQLLLFAASLAWLANYSARFLPVAVVASVVLAIAANPYLWELQATVMSEALTTPLLTILIGCILGFVMSGRRALVICAALICGLATTIRPSCLPLIVVPLSAIMFTPHLHKRFTLIGLVLLVAMAPVVVERIYSRVVHGEKLTSPIGRHAFMKAAVIEAPDTSPRSNDPLERRAVRALNDDFAPFRQTLQDAPDRNVRYILLTNYEACVAWACVDHILEDFQGVPPAVLNKVLFTAGLDRLRLNPVGYVELSATEYLRMWLLHPRKHPDLARKYNAFLARQKEVPLQALLGPEGQPTPPEQQNSLYRLNRVAFASIGILAAFLTGLLLFWRRSASHRVALSLLLGAQAVLILCALTAVGLPRYAMGMWPLLITGILFAAFGVLRDAARHKPGMQGENADHL